MNRILLIVTLLSFFAVESISAFEALHAHGDAGSPHAAQNDDCGCLCHSRADAVVVSDGMWIQVAAILLEIQKVNSPLNPHCISLDRPPKLFS